jgi:hypothetical protein
VTALKGGFSRATFAARASSPGADSGDGSTSGVWSARATTAAALGEKDCSCRVRRDKLTLTWLRHFSDGWLSRETADKSFCGRDFMTICDHVDVRHIPRVQADLLTQGSSTDFNTSQNCILRDSGPCVVKNKPYGSSNDLLCMEQGQRSGIDSDISSHRRPDSAA